MNLERSATNHLPRSGKVHDGLGATRQPGRDDVGAGGAGGFLAVLAGLESSPTAGPSDVGTASPGPLGSAGNSLLLPAAEPELPDVSQLLPDAGWQLDAAAMLAHLSRASQWLSSGGEAAPSTSTAVDPFGQAGLPGQPTPWAMPATALPPVVPAPTNGVGAGIGVPLPNRQSGLPSRMEPDLSTPLAASLPTAGRDGLGLPTQAPAAPLEPIKLQSAPPSSELDVVSLQAMRAQSAPAESSAGSVSVLSAVPSKPGALRLPPEPRDPALPVLPVDLRRPESPRAPIDVPQAVAPGAVAPSPTALSRGPTPAPQAEVINVAREAVVAGVTVLPPAAPDDTGPTLVQPVEPVKSMVSPAVPAHAAHDTKALQNLVESDLIAPVSVGLNATVSSGVSEGVNRSADRAAAKSADVHRGASGEGLWSPAGLVSSRPVEAPSAAQGGALPTPEMMVAEQVSYWISGKVQNAELRLDVFGRQPVDVSISMNGSEAQVEFRTDQPEVRQVLEGAVAHLKDLLKEEGLSLAGVFVGSSGQQRQGGQASAGPASEASLRQARVEVAQTTVSPRPANGHPTAGRSVDLFV